MREPYIRYVNFIYIYAIVYMLLKHGGNPSLKNNENETPTDLLLDSSKTVSEKKFRERKYLNI